MSQPMISVWRLHPRGVVIKPADPTLGGQAPASAKKYCGPYMHANASGFYLHSPIDLDLSFDPGRPIPWQWNIHGNGYTDDEVAITQEMPIRHLHFRREMLKRRTKLFLSGRTTSRFIPHRYGLVVFSRRPLSGHCGCGAQSTVNMAFHSASKRESWKPTGSLMIYG